MIWVVDKKVVNHLVQHGECLAEVPIRVTFEYAIESGAVVDGSLSTNVLYNRQFVCKRFPDLAEEALEADVQQTAQAAVNEHLVLSGFS